MKSIEPSNWAGSSLYSATSARTRASTATGRSAHWGSCVGMLLYDHLYIVWRNKATWYNIAQRGADHQAKTAAKLTMISIEDAMMSMHLSTAY